MLRQSIVHPPSIYWRCWFTRRSEGQRQSRGHPLSSRPERLGFFLRSVCERRSAQWRDVGSIVPSSRGDGSSPPSFAAYVPRYPHSSFTPSASRAFRVIHQAHAHGSAALFCGEWNAGVVLPLRRLIFPIVLLAMLVVGWLVSRAP